MEGQEVKPEEFPLPIATLLVKACKLCNRRYRAGDLIDDLCKACSEKISRGQKVRRYQGQEVRPVVCLSCGRHTNEKRAAKFWVAGRCGSCHRKHILAGKKADLLASLPLKVVLTQDEKATIESQSSDRKLPAYLIEESIIRMAAGQYVTEICDYLNSQHGVDIVNIVKFRKILSESSAFEPIINRLREHFDSKDARSLIPITNRFQLALRLEGLYQEAELLGSIRDRVAILKAANEMLANEEGKMAIQRTNILTIIQRISNNNKTQRAIAANFSETILEPTKLDDNVSVHLVNGRGSIVDGRELRSPVTTGE